MDGATQQYNRDTPDEEEFEDEYPTKKEYHEEENRVGNL